LGEIFILTLKLLFLNILLSQGVEDMYYYDEESSKSAVLSVVAKIMGFGLIAFLFFLQANLIMFKFSHAKLDNNSKWIGSWKSSQYPFVSGKIVVYMPPKLSAEEKKYKLFVYYNFWSVYEPGSFRKLEVETFFDDESLGGVSQVGKSQEINKKIGFTFWANSTEVSEQQIGYFGVSSQDKSIITGGYKSTNPEDTGYFEIKKYKEIVVKSN